MEKLLGDELGCGLTSRVVLIERDKVLALKRRFDVKTSSSSRWFERRSPFKRWWTTMRTSHGDLVSREHAFEVVVMSTLARELWWNTSLPSQELFGRDSPSGAPRRAVSLASSENSYLDIKADNVVLSDHVIPASSSWTLGCRSTETLDISTTGNQ